MSDFCSFVDCDFLKPSKRPESVDAKTRYEFGITKADIDKAKKSYTRTSKNAKGTIQGCEHPAACVVAQGIMNSMPDGITCMVQVGRTTTKIYIAGPNSKTVELITRYSTPQKLGKAIAKFDKTGLWSLEEGRYYLLPRKPSNNRWDQQGKGTKKPNSPDGPKKGVQSRFRAAATRRVLRSDKKIVKIV